MRRGCRQPASPRTVPSSTEIEGSRPSPGHHQAQRAGIGRTPEQFIEWFIRVSLQAKSRTQIAHADHEAERDVWHSIGRGARKLDSLVPPPRLILTVPPSVSAPVAFTARLDALLDFDHALFDVIDEPTGLYVPLNGALAPQLTTSGANSRISSRTIQRRATSCSTCCSTSTTSASFRDRLVHSWHRVRHCDRAAAPDAPPGRGQAGRRGG